MRVVSLGIIILQKVYENIWHTSKICPYYTEFLILLKITIVLCIVGWDPMGVLKDGYKRIYKVKKRNMFLMELPWN